MRIQRSETPHKPATGMDPQAQAALMALILRTAAELTLQGQGAAVLALAGGAPIPPPPVDGGMTDDAMELDGPPRDGNGAEPLAPPPSPAPAPVPIDGPAAFTFGDTPAPVVSGSAPPSSVRGRAVQSEAQKKAARDKRNATRREKTANRTDAERAADKEKRGTPAKVR